MKYPKLFVACEGTISETNNQMRNLCEVKNIGIKLNLDTVFNSYIFDYLIPFTISKNTPIFLDLKMFNGIRTMLRVLDHLKELVNLIINIHLLSGTPAVRAIVDKAHDYGINVFGVTVLSHYDDDFCKREFGRSLSNEVFTLTYRAVETGCDGVILPPNCLNRICNESSYNNLIKVCPGIRPTWAISDKIHTNPYTPKQAINEGADIIICGSPITKSANVIQYSVNRILAEIDYKI